MALLICCVATIVLLTGCKKTPVGYISDNMYYSLNPFTVSQGITTVSNGLVADGSTAPISVKLLSVRDLATGKDASGYLLKKDTVSICSGFFIRSMVKLVPGFLRLSLIAWLLAKGVLSGITR